MAIIGAHVVLYVGTRCGRVILRDAFGWRHVDAGDGWLIFAMPPSEVGVHPAEGPTFHSGVRHQLTLMCDNLDATVADLQSKGISAQGHPENEGWGITIMINLPGGLEVMLYEPRHPMAISS